MLIQHLYRNYFIVTTLEIRDATRLNGVKARRNVIAGR